MRYTINVLVIFIPRIYKKKGNFGKGKKLQNRLKTIPSAQEYFDVWFEIYQLSH